MAKTLFVSLVAWLLAIGIALADGRAYVLSLEGEGSATVTIDKAAVTAYIHDGGRKGRKGIAGATLEGKPILEYLRREGIVHLVISCSHPHDDHMGGLTTLLTKVEVETIKSFKTISFLDGIGDDAVTEDGKKIDRLVDLFKRSWGSNTASPEIRYANAIGENGFSKLGITSKDLRVTNYKYDPNSVGTDIHDAAVIVEYEVKNAKGATRTVVDFDDASTKLIEKWSSDNSTRGTHAVLMAHHGSRNNDMSSVLGDAKTRGITDVIFTVNEGNRFLHPTPEALEQAIRAVGLDHVHITGSASGDALEIAATGDFVRGQGKDAVRARLEAFIAGRIADAQHKIEKATSAKRVVELQRDIDALATLSEQFDIHRSDHLSRSGVVAFMKTREQTRADEVAGRDEAIPKRDDDINSGSPIGDSTDRKGPNGPDMPGGGGSPGSSGGGGAPNAGGEHGKTAGGELSASGKQTASSPRPIHVDSERGAPRYSTFQRASTSRMSIRFGGVVLGNKPTGPDIARLQIVSVGKPAQVKIKLTLKDGSEGYLGPISTTQLWAAYNFVSPTQQLKQRFKGIPIEPDAGGLVGMVRQKWLAWTFAINPAIADTSLAKDAMRLDMAVAVAIGNEDLPPSVKKLRWKDIGEFDTYQWFDEPAEISLIKDEVSVRSQDGSNACVMRLRLLKESEAPGFDVPTDDPEVEKVVQGQTKQFEDSIGKPIDSDYAEEMRSLVRKRLGMQRAVSKEIEKLTEKETISDEDRDRLQDQIQIRMLTSGQFDEEVVAADITQQMCETLPFLRRINELANIVAVFHRFLDSGSASLPPLPKQLVPDLKNVDATMLIVELWNEVQSKETKPRNNGKRPTSVSK